MLKLTFLYLLLPVLWLVSIYEYSITGTDGNTLPLQAYAGKKLLIVNIASQSPYVGQLAALDSLQKQFADSLVVIAIPSNSFGREPLADSAIKTLVHTQYHAELVLGRRGPVTGTGALGLYGWLTDASKNGIWSNPVTNDFYKFLVNKEGHLVGVFGPSQSPMSNAIHQAILNN